MITYEQYFGKYVSSPDATPSRKLNAYRLLAAITKLEAYAVSDGILFPDNPSTRSGVSGQTYGGFRPQDCPQGAAHSAHKEGLAVDRYDPVGAIDDWCLANLDKVKECGIYIEIPSSTPGWSHWSIKSPASGHTVFIP